MSDIHEKVLSGVQELPTLPTVYSALSDAMARPGSTAAQVAEIVSSDQAATFRVLKVVNSAFYGFPGRIDTISRAVVILGFDEIKNLILATSVMDLFTKQDSALDFRPSDFWAHSIAVGVLTRIIGQEAGVVTHENLFVAGILHDIGKLMLFEMAEEEFARALRYSAENNCPIREAEMKTLKTDHTIIGDLIGNRWRLPQSLRNAIRYHHAGMIHDKPDMIVAAVHLANFIARAMEFGYSGDNLVPQPNEEAWDTLKITKKTIQKIMPAAKSSYEDAVGLMLQR